VSFERLFLDSHLSIHHSTTGVRLRSDTELGKSILHQMLREEAMRNQSSIAAKFFFKSRTLQAFCDLTSFYAAEKRVQGTGLTTQIVYKIPMIFGFLSPVANLIWLFI
jgi:hypothetical protein